MTVTEFNALLSGDAEYQRGRAEIEEKQKAHELFCATEQRPIIEDLSRAGVVTKSVWELVNRPTDYEAGFDVILKHLQIEYSDGTREGLARSLASKKAASYLSQVVELYEAAPESGFKEGLAVAIAAMTQKKDFGLLERLIRKRSLGDSRIFFVRSLIRIGREAGWKILDSLEKDPALSKEIMNRKKDRDRRAKR